MPAEERLPSAIDDTRLRKTVIVLQFTVSSLRSKFLVKIGVRVDDWR